jgi:Fur family transcriptional regulator, ferric uptake regulator
MTTQFLTTMERAGCRLTEPRRVVAELVARHEGHFTAAEIVDQAQQRQPGLGRATVFRALDLFTSLGLVERIDLPDGDHAYVTCEQAHHHHAICTSCGRSLDLPDMGLSQVLHDAGARLGFRITTHRLELFGLCASCQAAGRS